MTRSDTAHPQSAQSCGHYEGNPAAGNSQLLAQTYLDRGKGPGNRWAR
ncbi:hypothetical protein GCM10022223_10780 [Kineosporia mesophila]|uniref:Uncharacterized protein n=1 Tax=Kineosporia mesophila TaxID=566012 RepID=A0ABP6Z627_9ACTN|nr:hypothetical protein [Kineosporia mesophila]MCD5352557.1 hypothetical protein [Kineosporia mesophila]